MVESGMWSQAAHHSRHGSVDAAGQRATGTDRRSAAHRQDDHAAAHRQRHCSKTIPNLKLIVLLIDERPEEVTDMKRNCQWRSHRQQPGPGRRKSRAAVAAGHRTLQSPLAEMGQDVFLADGLDHATGPCVQQMGRQHGPHDERWCRHQGDGHSQKACSRRPGRLKKAAR